MQGILFSSLPYGGSITVLFSGYLADLYGPRQVALLALLAYSALTLLSPLFASWDYYAFLVARSVMGLADGAIFPSVAGLAARWTPPFERSAMAAIYRVARNNLAPIKFLLLFITRIRWGSSYLLPPCIRQDSSWGMDLLRLPEQICARFHGWVVGGRFFIFLIRIFCH